MSLIRVITKPCVVCGKTSEMEVDVSGYHAWKEGEYIQHALPELSADDRELLMTGTHPACWDILWPEEDQ